MNRIQRYLFSNVLAAAMTIIGGLSLLALLAQGLSQTDLIVDNLQSAMTYLKVVALGSPMIIAILGPLALFVASLNALNRAHRDSEIVIAHSAGMTRWQVLSPLLRLATLVAIIHLCVNLFVQPLAQKELKATLFDARSDLATSLIRPGAFTHPSKGLTLYSRESKNGMLQGMLISDTRVPDRPVDYIAQTGRMVKVEGSPAILMQNGQIQQLDENNQLSVLDFDDYVLELTDFLTEDSDLVLKASDRFLSELLFPDMGDYYQHRDSERYLAEAHSRMSRPLLNFVMVIIAVMAVIGGDVNRRGYMRRIAISVAGALFLIVLVLTIQPAAEDDSALNIVQYALPLSVAFILATIFLAGDRLRFFRPGRKSKPAIAATEAA